MKVYLNKNIFNISGQAMIEALVVVVFTTVIMLAFIQVCIMVVDDMIANEAAFVGMRSAVVTKDKLRYKEVSKRIKTYLLFFYPAISFETDNFNFSNFVLSNKKAVEKYLGKSEASDEEYDAFEVDNNDSNARNKSISIWKGKKTVKDYSGKNIMKETVKVYYFTKALFGSLISSDNSFNNSFKNRRYQSARNRMIPSPDEKYYYRAFRGAKKFEKD